MAVCHVLDLLMCIVRGTASTVFDPRVMILLCISSLDSVGGATDDGSHHGYSLESDHGCLDRRTLHPPCM
jgi:hypothetical protein